MKLKTKEVGKFIDWFGEQINPKNNEPYRLSYVHFFRKTWKYFITEAVNEDDIEVNVNIEKKIFKKKSDKGLKGVYLTMEQLKQFKSAKYDANDTDIKSTGTSKEMFQWCQDLAIVSAACGYRWEDLILLRKEYFKYDKIKDEWNFHIDNSAKADNHAIIPVFDQDVVKIFKKYDEAFPLFMEDPTFNETVKLIGKMAGLTEEKTFSHKHPVTLEDIKETKPFFSWITHRTFRRTAASNWVRHYNVPIVVAMYYNTNTSESVFRDYISLTPQEYAEIGHKQFKELKKIKIRMKVVA